MGEAVWPPNPPEVKRQCLHGHGPTWGDNCLAEQPLCKIYSTWEIWWLQGSWMTCKRLLLQFLPPLFVLFMCFKFVIFYSIVYFNPTCLFSSWLRWSLHILKICDKWIEKDVEIWCKGNLIFIVLFSQPCRAPLHEDYPQYHGYNGNPRVTWCTCGAIGERVQVILMCVWAIGVEFTSHLWTLTVMRVKPKKLSRVLRGHLRMLEIN